VPGGGKAGRSRLLDEICLLCGYERKYVSKLLGASAVFESGNQAPTFPEKNLRISCVLVFLRSCFESLGVAG
jgi:hypothetical protein